jgi:acyl dehydratase
MTRPSLTLEAYRRLIGQVIGYSEWMLIDQARIGAFADTTLDHQYIHVDPELAKASPFGSTIAHGFLTLSLLSHFASQVVPELVGTVAGVNYGFERLRFVNPVRCDERIRGHFKLLEIAERAPKQLLFQFDASVEIEGATRPALHAHWLTMRMMA